MKTKELNNLIVKIEEEFQILKHGPLQELLSKLLNLTEEVISENQERKKEIQNLKDEIARLKGEQGKPDIKAKNKQGDVSSEVERKKAEESPEEKENKIGYKLSKSTLGKLKEQELSPDLLEKLGSIGGRQYDNPEMFISAIEACLAEEQLDEETKNLLLKYAKYKKRQRKAKLPEIKIDREEFCKVDTDYLPEDAIYKGQENKVVQDVIIKTDNVRFKRESYWSPSEKKTYLGPIPKGYEGDFGPGINSQIVNMEYSMGMSIPKIKEFFRNINVQISGSYISNRLTKARYMDIFHEEKSQIHQASIESSLYQQIDDTGSRVNGTNHYTQILCNPLCTLFFTTEKKDRLTVIDVLRNFRERSFIFNQETFILLEKLKVPKGAISLMRKLDPEIAFGQSRMDKILKEIFPTASKKSRNLIRTMEACAIASYHMEDPSLQTLLLLCDDAPQFKLIVELLGLCWVHDGRHYKKLSPFVDSHREKLDNFLKRYWEYYGKIFQYKRDPTEIGSKELSLEFDSLFSTKTGYNHLDERILKTKAKKEELLLVLEHPELPLHNNLAENGARVEKRKSDISLQTKTIEGTKAKDTMMSIVETCKKLGVSSYAYITDRISGSFELPSLAEVIRAKAKEASL